MLKESTTNYETVPEFLSGGGEMGQRIREFDWTTTSLGRPENWPQSLKTCIRIMLTSRQPIWIGWGKELIKFYNDPYKNIVRGKHPWALGTPASIVWKDIWKDIEPMLQQVMEKNEGTYVESQLLIMERNGYPEETYYTFSYTPIPGDEGGTAGMFCANTDDTEKIISERQLKTLTELGKELIDSKSPIEVIENTIDTLSENPYDFPLCLFRRIENNKAIFVYSSPLGTAGELLPKEIDLKSESDISQIIRKAIVTRKPQILSGVRDKIGKLPTGAWDTPPDKVIVIPILPAAMKDAYGVLVVAVNPFRLLDEKYTGFFSLVADQMATSFTHVHVLEEERQRAAALAEIDKAKTIFFTNISHEFRTPLTLMLGSLEQMLSARSGRSARERMSIETTYRNAMRLLRLVNNLLDFSRIEAGRIKAQFQPTDVGKFTADLASNFRAVAESAGLRFHISISPKLGPVYLDKEMWEKIVLNLLSNAFKYTLQGSIDLSLTMQQERVALKIKDTGVGIPESELPKMFERFHRVENVTGRSFEGTGIGLSLVKELVQIHGGEISVFSKLGEGSEFIVSIPTGKDHLPQEHVIEKPGDVDSTISEAFIEEATSLSTESSADEMMNIDKSKSLVLVVDDNNDMRNYMKSLLEQKFAVMTASDGANALHKIKDQKPDLIVSDIMMPVMDGIQLLREVKANPAIANIPVILVSARAGEESTIEGFEIGAEDYLVKPFSSKELMARVSAQIGLYKKRRSLQNELHNLFLQAPTAVQILRGPDFVYELANDRSLAILNKTADEIIGRRVIDVVAGAEEQGVIELLKKTYESGERFVIEEVPLVLNINGERREIFYKAIYQPLKDENGNVTGIMITGDDISPQVIARKKIEESEAKFRTLAETLPQMVWIRNVEGTIEYASSKWEQYTGIADIRTAWPKMTHPDDWQEVMRTWDNAIVTGKPFRHEVRVKNKDGEYRWHYAAGEPVLDENGKLVRWIGALTDIHMQKTFAQNLERLIAERTEELRLKNTELQNWKSFLEQLIDSSVEFISVLDSNLNYITANRKFLETVRLSKEQIGGKNLLAVHPNVAGTDLLESIHKALKGETVYHDKRPSVTQPEIYIDTYFVPLQIQDKIEGVIIMARDVTDIVGTERLLEQKNQELLRSNEDLQQFAHVASHDLKEPVRKVRMFANRLSSEFDGTLPKSAKVYLSKMERAAERMYTMIEGVLQYSSLTAMEENIEEVDLNELIAFIKSDLEIAIDEKHAVIESATLPKVQGSDILLYQLFYNLINNSLKFAKPNVSPVIKINSDTVLATAGEGAHNDGVEAYYQISIKDNGIGFNEADSTRIFKPFSRLNSKDQFEGTGLGLALCKKIVERHGGMISASGVDGEGSTFYIYLPKRKI
jgi:PAS domain S-box-containing protein